MSITVLIMESEAVAGPVRRTRPANWVGNEADKQGRQTKPANQASKPSQQAKPASQASKPSQQTKLKNKAGKQGRQTRPAKQGNGATPGERGVRERDAGRIGSRR
ncbi:hypothetical protein [Achromobacter ruhlandii]|uniref:hypothetical protein n=1 Tax=Achromobacter ruhlandii TaxID=72557 RepID=UPI001EED9D2D|nr:hypothetical protein [Achromobacter ruhlandii]